MLAELEQLQTVTPWFERAVEAYVNDQPTFLDSNGELIPGIYLNMPNDIYHALPALSSSKLKTFVKSPAEYYREYLSDVDRKRTLTQKRTFDAGTYSHELVLEPEGFYERYFREPVASEFPDAISRVDDLKKYCEENGIKVNKSATKPTIIKAIEESGLKNTNVFELELKREREKQGAKGEVIIDGEVVTTWGGKVGIDGIVWDDAHRACKTTRKHSQADAYLSNGLPEVAIIAVCEDTGMMLKVKFDWLRFDSRAVDLKTTQSTNPRDFKRQIKALHYDIQQEFYKYVAELAQVYVPEFIFVATEYVSKDICQPFKLPNKWVAQAHSVMKRSLLELEECQKNDNWYGWSKEDVVIEFE